MTVEQRSVVWLRMTEACLGGVLTGLLHHGAANETSSKAYSGEGRNTHKNQEMKEEEAVVVLVQ